MIQKEKEVGLGNQSIPAQRRKYSKIKYFSLILVHGNITPLGQNASCLAASVKSFSQFWSHMCINTVATRRITSQSKSTRKTAAWQRCMTRSCSTCTGVNCSSRSFTSRFALARFRVPPRPSVSFRAKKSMPCHYPTALSVARGSGTEHPKYWHRPQREADGMRCRPIVPQIGSESRKDRLGQWGAQHGIQSVLRHVAPGSVWGWGYGLGSTVVRSLCPLAWPLRFYSPAPTALCLWLGQRTAGAGPPAPSSGQKMKWVIIWA